MESGGVFYVKEAKSVTLDGNTIHYFYANITGSIMHSISTGVVITLQNNFFHKYPSLT